MNGIIIMVRYTIILDDKTYIKALKKAMSENKSLGKWINDLIREAVKDVELDLTFEKEKKEQK